MNTRKVKFRKSFLYPVGACAIFIYIYIQMTSSLVSKPTISLYNSEQEFATDVTIITANRDINRILTFKHKIRRANEKQSIQNDDLNDTVSLIIVVQVHDRIHYLKHLVNSLKAATGISKTLIIFSHSYYNEDINRVIWHISFAKVMQIYYPYSVQLYPSVFPGNDQKTCNEVMACRKSNRQALLNQNKHHWWWKVAYVFDSISVIDTYNGYVLFLEENQYVTKDFIYITKILEGLTNASLPHCDIISLGSNEPRISSYFSENTSFIVKPWGTTESVGIAFTRDTWKEIKGLADKFCRFNDNRWDKSLSFLASKRPLGKFYVLTVESPRIFQFNKCNNKKICDDFEKVRQVETFVSNITNRLFPYKLHIINKDSVEETDEGNGGWADSRDHELCRYFSRDVQAPF